MESLLLAFTFYELDKKEQCHRAILGVLIALRNDVTAQS